MITEHIIFHHETTTTTPLLVRDYRLPAAMTLTRLGPGIAWKREFMLWFFTFPTLDEARAALALGWTP